MSPLRDLKYTNTNLVFQNGVPSVFIGGQQGYPEGLMYARRSNFAPRLGISHNLPKYGIVIHTAYGIFYTPVDMNTWCNQRHNVPFVFPETQQSDNFIPAFNGYNFAPAVLGQTTVSFAAFDPHAPSQYIQHRFRAASHSPCRSSETPRTPEPCLARILSEPIPRVGKSLTTDRARRIAG